MCVCMRECRCACVFVCVCVCVCARVCARQTKRERERKKRRKVVVFYFLFCSLCHSMNHLNSRESACNIEDESASGFVMESLNTQLDVRIP